MLASYGSLSHTNKIIVLARIAHWLTVAARSTYEVGTVNILEPELLRGYNELMHQVTDSLMSHSEAREGMPFEVVLEILDEFGRRFNKKADIDWVLKVVQERPIPTAH